MCLTEYDEEEFKRVCREDGYAEGRTDGLAEGRSEKAVETAMNLLKINLLSPEQISQSVELSLEKVLELQKSIAVKA